MSAPEGEFEKSSNVFITVMASGPGAATLEYFVERLKVCTAICITSSFKYYTHFYFNLVEFPY